MEKEILVKVEGVSKKFARDLKKSLSYGIRDIGRELIGKQRSTELRKTEFWAVNDVNFELRRGECLGLIGHNGAGKSTLLKMLNGLIKPDKGKIEIRGRVVAMIELGAGFNPVLSGRENIYSNASILGFTKEETDAKLESIIEFSEIRDFIDAPVQSYSSGMKVRLGFAVVAHMEPDVLIIDEVLAVGDVGFRIKCYNRIQQILKNCAVIFVSHSMPSIGRICSSAMLMNKGSVQLYSGTVHRVIEEYNRLFESKSQTNIDSFNSTVEVVNVQLNASSVHEQNLDFDSPINFELFLRSKELLEKVVLSIVFIDREEKIVASTNTDPFSLNTGLNRIGVEIKNRFNIGGYSVHLVLSSEKSQGIYSTLIRCSSIFRFFVTSAPVINSSPILLPNKSKVVHEPLAK